MTSNGWTLFRGSLVLALAWAGLALPSLAQDVLVTRRGGEVEGGPAIEVNREGVRFGRGPSGTVDRDWTDVEALQTRKPLRIRLVSGEVLDARVSGFDGQNLLVNHDVFGAMRLPINSLPPASPLTPGAEPRQAEGAPATPLTPKDWTGKVSLAISATGGNADTLNGALEAFIERNFSHDRLEFFARAVYGEAEGEEVANAQLVRGKWEHHYSERLYSFIGAEFGRDAVQELDLRAFLNLGVGYKVWQDSDKEFLALEGGVGYRHESFSSSTNSRNDVTGRAAMIYRDIWWDKAEFSQLVEFVAPLTDMNSFFARSETSISVPISENWSIRNSLVFNYQNDPPRSAKKLDWLVTAGIEYSF
jgi:putative salt-induced outer membrane protein YdiY